MPAVELTDEQIALLDAVQKMGGRQWVSVADRAVGLHQKLIGSKGRREYEKLIKAEFPDVRTTDDLAAPYVEQIDTLQKRLDEIEASRKKEREDAAAEKAQGDFNTKWADVVKRWSLTEEGEEKLAKHMKENGIAEPLAGALHYYDRNPIPAAPVTPTSIAPQNWAAEFGTGKTDDESLKLLQSNPERWAEIEAAAVLTEQRRAAA